MASRHFFLYALVGFVLLNSSVASGASHSLHWHNPSYLLKAFTEVALRNEYSFGSDVVRRWEKPIHIWIDHQVGDRGLHTDLVNMHIKHLAALTQHPIKLTSSAKDANFTIVFTQQKDWKRQVGKLFGSNAESAVHGAVCMASFSVNGRSEIVRAGVIIPVDQARMHGKLVACIVEEITQVMGLPNDSEAVYPSIFNDKTPEDLLSGLDGLLLKMLYSPEVKSGMNETSVKPILEKLLKQWQKNGTLKSATYDVKSGELYPLLGY